MNRARTLLLFAALSSTSVAADTLQCTAITALPAVINQPGTYCLRSALSTPITSGAAVSITAADVELDCNDMAISGHAAGPATQTVGIDVSGTAFVRIRNCRVRGFETGVRFVPSGPRNGTGNAVEDSAFVGNTRFGINAGNSTLIRRNLVADTGGNPLGRSSAAIVGAFDSEIVDNVVDGVLPASGQQDATGVILFFPRALVARNRIRGLAGGPESVALEIAGGGIDSRVLFEHNDIAAAGGTGIGCSSYLGIARGNTLNGVIVPLDGCIDGGRNTGGTP